MSLLDDFIEDLGETAFDEDAFPCNTVDVVTPEGVSFECIAIFGGRDDYAGLGQGSGGVAVFRVLHSELEAHGQTEPVPRRGQQPGWRITRQNLAGQDETWDVVDVDQGIGMWVLGVERARKVRG